jgi:DNA-directed RNA polymerase specialized sigma24 family protein
LFYGKTIRHLRLTIQKTRCIMPVAPDELWKVSFRMLMPQFVEFFFPQHYNKIDWQKEIVFLDKELQTIQLNSRPKNRIADVFVMLHRKRGKPLYILLHIEIQGYLDKVFGLRAHQMRYRIEDKFGVNPVMLCVFTDSNLHFHPKEYAVETWGTGVRTYFNTYKVMENHPNKYKNPDSIVSLIMETVYHSTQLKGKSDDEIMGLYLQIARKLFSKGYTKHEIEVAYNFIEAHIKFGNNDSYGIFEEKIDDMVTQFETTEEILSNFFDKEKKMLRMKEAEERAERKAERERQAKERSVLLLLKQGVSSDMIAKVLDVPVENILQIQEKYKDNNPIDEILNH